MSLRTKLLLLSLLTLILPWAGWQYAQQMETTLRRGQEDALLTTAQVLSRVVASEPELLYRVPELRREFDPERGDLFAPLLRDASAARRLRRRMAAAGACRARFRRIECRRGSCRTQSAPRCARAIDALYVEVAQPSVRYEVPSRDETRPADKSDRVIVLTRDEFGHERAWSISAIAPGPIMVRACEIGAPWKPSAEEVPYVEGSVARNRQGLRDRAARAVQSVRNATRRAGARCRRRNRRADARARLGAHGLRSAEAAARSSTHRTACAFRSWTRTAGCWRGPARCRSRRRRSIPACSATTRASRARSIAGCSPAMQRSRGRTDFPMECGARRSTQRATASAAPSGSTSPAASPRWCARPCRFRHGDAEPRRARRRTGRRTAGPGARDCAHEVAESHAGRDTVRHRRDHRVRGPPVTAHSLA